VLFITGFAAVALHAQRSSPASAEARVLSKPFYLNELVDQIDNMLAA